MTEKTPPPVDYKKLAEIWEARCKKLATENEKLRQELLKYRGH